MPIVDGKEYVVVEFLAMACCFNAGQIGGVDPETAALLVEQGKAVYHAPELRALAELETLVDAAALARSGHDEQIVAAHKLAVTAREAVGTAEARLAELSDKQKRTKGQDKKDRAPHVADAKQALQRFEREAVDAEAAVKTAESEAAEAIEAHTTLAKRLDDARSAAAES